MDFVNYASSAEIDGSFVVAMQGNMFVQPGETVKLSLVQAAGGDALYLEIVEPRTSPSGTIDFITCEEMLLIKTPEDLLLHLQKGGEVNLIDLDTGSQARCKLESLTPPLQPLSAACS